MLSFCLTDICESEQLQICVKNFSPQVACKILLHLMFWNILYVLSNGRMRVTNGGSAFSSIYITSLGQLR